MRRARGQIVIEFVALIGIVLAILAVVQQICQRGVQGFIKGAADQMHAEGDTRDLQAEGLRYESGDKPTFGEGSVLTRASATATDSAQQITLTERPGGIRRQDFSDENNYTRTTGALKGYRPKTASYSEVVAHVEEKPVTTK